MIKFRKGQSTLEYVIILAAVVGAIILVASFLRKQLPASYQGLTSKMAGKVGQVNF
jgi:hypothetical protein